jgi:undecaprenyl-diphosphatase
MTYFQAILLGVVQGATEFLPVSSSGHLVIVPFLFGWDIPPQEAFIFDVLVQVATLVAVIAYFWSDLLAIAVAVASGLISGRPWDAHQARMGWYLALASIPAGLVGLIFKDTLEQLFSNPLASALFLLGTAALLTTAERVGERSRALHKMRWFDALWIGTFQILALLPGISRSGATITGAMTRDFERSSAARFSFLMSVPIMLAAGLSATLDLIQIPDLSALLPPFMIGFATAAVVGYLSIRWLLAFLTRRPLYVFAIYCTLLASITLAIYVIRFVFS